MNTSDSKNIKKIAIFGGTFDPPTNAHTIIAKKLCESYDIVVIVPCGTRKKQSSPMYIPGPYRAAMVDLAFNKLDKNILIDLHDLEEQIFTPSITLVSKYKALGEIWIACGMDLFEPDPNTGKSQIQEEWEEGNKLWKTANFCIIQRPQGKVLLNPPQHHKILPYIGCDNLTPAEVRNSIYLHQKFDNLVPPKVFDFIDSCRLYCGLSPPSVMPLVIKPKSRLLIFYDERNPKAKSIADSLRFLEYKIDPTLICVIGGDGTMLRAIREYWRLRLPFFGINAGTVGYLLNEIEINKDSDDPLFHHKEDLLFHHLPLMLVEATIEKINEENKGTIKMYAFNDVWVERSTGQTACLEVRINGKVKIPHLVSDGILVSTAAGSTAYAYAMGCSPIPVGSQLLCVVASNPCVPHSWKPVYLNLDSKIEVTVQNSKKRPVRGFVDGIEMGNVSNMLLKASNVAYIRLIFVKKRDVTEKLQRLQFPDFI